MMNEQELFERFDRIARAFEGMSEGVERSTETTRAHTDATQMDAAQIQESIAAEKKRKALRETDQKEEWAYSARIRKNFDDLGISIRTYIDGEKTLSKIEKSKETDMKIRQAAEKELNKILEENAEGYKDLSKAAKEKYKNDLKNEVAMTKAYGTTGRFYDATGKLVKETDGLTIAQRAEIAVLKEHDRVVQQMSGNVSKFGMDLGKLAIKGTFDMFVAGIKGAYAGTIAYQDAILEGAGANTAAAAQISAEMNALAGALESTGSSMVSLGAEAAKTALEMIILGGPIGILVGVIMLLVGAVVAYEGYEKQSQAAKLKRDAELQAKQAAIYDQLYKDFTQLSSASLTGAGGMTALWHQLGQVSMSVKDFGKFNKILVEGSASLATFASSAVEGVQKFTDVAGSVIKSGLGDIFRQMGMTNEEMAEHTLKYMEQQRSLGLLQNKSATDLKIGTANYIRELDRVAALTGQSRKDQEKGRDAIRAMAQVSAAKNIAQRRGDTKGVERLEVGEKFAGSLVATMPETAAAIAKKISGAALDQSQVAMMRNQAELLRYIDSGGKDQIKMQMLFAQGLEKQNNANAFLTRTVGEVSALQNDTFAAGEKEKQVRAGLLKAEAEAKKAGKPFDAAAFLDKQREVTDPFTKAQADAAQKAKETQIAFEKNVKGLSTDLPNLMEAAINKLPTALSGPIMQFFKYVEEFGKYVMKLLRDPSDTLKETLTGKDKSQRDAENLIDKQKELKSVDERIKSLKDSTENPEKAKKLADDNFKLAEQELKLKEQAIAELHKKMAPGNWKPGATEEEKRLQAKEKEKLAIQGAALYKEEQAAKEKYKLAQKAVDDNKTGFFSKSVDEKKKELEALIKKKENLANETLKLEQQVKSNPASTTAAGFAKTYGSSPAYSMAMAGGSGGGGAGNGGAASYGTAFSTSNAQLKDSGLRLKQGDTQKEGATIDPKLLEMAKATQKNVPGFNYFSGFNDVYHQEKTPNSRHTKGLAFDFTVNPGRGLDKPSKEQSDLIIDLLKGYGAENVKNEYDDTSGKFRTGGHFHAELPLPKGYDGGIFDGPKAGFPVELHGREAIVPLPNPGDKISIDKAQQDTPTSTTKGALSSVVADNNTTSSKDNSSAILMDLYSMMESKFDDLIDKVSTTNTYTNKLLKYSQV